MSDLRKLDQSLQFGDGLSLPVEQLGVIGDLQDVAVCPGIHVPVASVSQIAQAMNSPTIFTATGAYVLKPDAKVEFRKDDIMFKASLKRGLYVARTKHVMRALKENARGDVDSSSESDDEEEK